MFFKAQIKIKKETTFQFFYERTVLFYFFTVFLFRISVPPAWGTWSSFGACSASCGDGTQTRNRICEPNKECPDCEDGKCHCDGDEDETVECNEQCCERKHVCLLPITKCF